MSKEFPSMEEFEALMHGRAYRSSRRLFGDYYKTAICYRDNDTLTNSQFEELAQTIRIGSLVLKYLSNFRRNRSRDNRYIQERAVLRKKVDALRAIISDPDKKIIPDDLEERV